MDTSRLILLIIFCVSLYMLGENWMKQYGPKPVSKTDTTSQSATTSSPDAIPSTAGQGTAADIPGSTATPAKDAAPAVASSNGELMTLETDLMRVMVNTIGGDIQSVELLTHRDVVDDKKNFFLLENNKQRVYVAQSGLIGPGVPNHKSPHVAGEKAVKLADGSDEARLEMTAQEPGSAVKVKKIISVKRGSYVINVSYHIENGKSEAIKPDAYFHLLRDDQPAAGDSRWIATFTGIAMFTQEGKYEKHAFSDITKGKAKLPRKSGDGWIGMVQHYFVAAWLPTKDVAREFYGKAVGNNLFQAGVMVPAGEIAAGQSSDVSMPLYVGPQDQDKLEKLAPGLDLTVDYGWLTIVAKPMFQFLHAIYEVVKNWGVAIIILTIIIKLIFFPLSAASYKSMARMRLLAPKLQKLKEQYGDDRQKLHQAMMELYKTEKINPLGGCLPIVVQIPVFIALYWVLLGSVEMRNSPFMLWIQDLSRPDPFYVLPVLMGISMIIQTRLNPEPPDPVQAKVMKIMPVAFSVFFFFFPAGLVLYWLVNNILSIAQQWYITRKLESIGLGHAKR